MLEAMRNVANPQYTGVIFRQTNKQVENPGGLWDQSLRIYPLAGADPKAGSLRWNFPSGAYLKFNYLERDEHVLNWQGAELAFVGFDELTHFSQYQFFYMLSRNRTTCGIRPYVRATCNPDADSWVANFIAWWLDADTGFPLPERAGVLRWMARLNEQLEWGESWEALYARLPDQVTPPGVEEDGPGVEGWVEAQHRAPPKSVTFIPAKLQDNRLLMRADPSYLGSLMALPLVERERLLGGNWKIRPAAGKVFNRAWFEIVEIAPAGGEDCRYWDLAATARKLDGKGNPDYTAGVKLRKGKDGVFYVLDCVAGQWAPHEADEVMKNVTTQDEVFAANTGARYRVRWEIEPGSSGIRESLRLSQMLAGFDAKGMSTREQGGDKVTRARGLAAQAGPPAFNVKLVRGPWNDAWLTHLHAFPDGPKDDILDASAGSFNALAKPLRLAVL